MFDLQGQNDIQRLIEILYQFPPNSRDSYKLFYQNLIQKNFDR